MLNVHVLIRPCEVSGFGLGVLNDECFTLAAFVLPDLT